MKKLQELAEGDPKFKAWAQADLIELTTTLEEAPAMMEAMVEKKPAVEVEWRQPRGRDPCSVW